MYECNFVKKQISIQVFSCEFCETFKSTYFAEQLRTVVIVGCSTQFSNVGLNRFETKHITDITESKQRLDSRV